MVDTKISGFTQRISPAPADNEMVIAQASGPAQNEAVPMSMVSLEHVTGSDADTTMDVGKLYIVDMSSWATAVRTYRLPTTAAVGEKIGIYSSAGSATYELAIRTTALSGDTINNTNYDSVDATKLFITKESLLFECITANTAWRVVHDGRIATESFLMLSADSPSLTGGNETEWQNFDGNGVTALSNIGDIHNTTNGRLTARRDAGWFLSQFTWPATAQSGNSYHVVKRDPDGTPQFVLYRVDEQSPSKSVRYGTTAYVPDVSDGDVFAAFWKLATTSALVGGGTHHTNYIAHKEVLKSI